MKPCERDDKRGAAGASLLRVFYASRGFDEKGG